LEILKNSGVDFEIINYLNGELKEKEFKNILEKLNISVEKIVRKGEKVFKENFKEKSKSFSEKD
jgi:arsenate reductase